MLILARRPGQRILFPGLGITVEVLRSQGSVTRLGIEAPDDVVVLREEVATIPPSGPLANAPDPQQSAEVRNRQQWRHKLNQLTSRLQQLQERLETGKVEQTETQLNDLLNQLSDLEQMTSDAIVKSSPPRVLLVEDQDNERELLATCLRLGGIEVTTAANGREAFDLLHDQDLPDLVLLDMRMPDIDGPTLLKAIRDDLRLHNLRVFAVSGSCRTEFGPNPLPLDGWFSKPVRVDSLLQAVRNEHAGASAM